MFENIIRATFIPDFIKKQTQIFEASVHKREEHLVHKHTCFHRREDQLRVFDL